MLGQQVVYVGNLRFRNPSNGYIEEVRHPGLWCLIFGFFYLAYKGAWMAAIIAVVAAFLTAGISWLFFPFIARKFVAKAYLQRGWQLVGTDGSVLTIATY